MPMNAIELLKEDHRVVEDLFGQIEALTPSKFPPILKKIKGALETHAHIEEKVFYPHLLKEGNKDLVDVVREGLEEHDQMKQMLRKVTASSKKDVQFEAKVKVMIEDTRHHVREEENEMFSMVRDQFSGDVLDLLGEKMQAEKDKYQKARGIKPLAAPKGTVTRLIDAAGDLVSGILTPENDNSKASKKTGSKKVINKRSGSRNSNNGQTAGAKKPGKAAAAKK